MKTRLLILACFVCAIVRAQTNLNFVDVTTLRTNAVANSGTITVPGQFTNATFTASNSAAISQGDTSYDAFTKVNLNDIFLYSLILSNANYFHLLGRTMTNEADITSLSSSLSDLDARTAGAVTNIVFTNTVTLPSGSPAAVTNLGSVGGIAFISISVPAGTNGAPGTNFVTVNQFTNVVLSSQQVITYSTNNRPWGASNYLGRVNGFYKGIYYPGNDGGNPPQDLKFELRGSLNGTNGWFVITNGFQTTNFITLVSTNTPGGLGSATLYSVDKWELLGRTNYFFGQRQRFDTPTDGSDAATKDYVDTMTANIRDGNFTTYTSNNVYHLIHIRNGIVSMDISGITAWIPVNGLTLDGTGTNVLMDIYQTNLVPGWFIETSTNLLLINAWLTYTNYAMTTNAGIVTFKAPINFSEPMRFYRGRGNTTNSVTITPPLTVLEGTIYTSNAWNLTAITNVMPNFSTRFCSSNGVVVGVKLSNGVVYIKAIGP
jgi:hypothetical protein